MRESGASGPEGAGAGTGAGAPRRVLFVTGRLAEPALRRVLADMAPPFEYAVAVMKITVAALMTTEWIGRFLQPDGRFDLVLIPGLCEGAPEILQERIGLPVAKGPQDLREIPGYFGRNVAALDYGAWDIEILAEINNAPKISRAAIRTAADYYRASGADVIDIGCTPGVPFPELELVIGDLVGAGMRVSIDTFDGEEIRRAVGAGADLVLSLNASNVAVGRHLAGAGARVVVVPDLGGPMETIEPTLEALDAWGVPALVDPILEPIGFGFMASLERYAEARRRWPSAEMLMGIGNLTELTAADSTGVNALLVAVCQELGIRAVLTTEVIPWARGVVREVDVARRLMHYAVTERVVPKGIDDRLVTTRDVVLLSYPEDELRALQSRITDPNFRIFADSDAITVFNAERFVRGTDIQEIFDRLDVEEPRHAFYLGKELARASLARTLGKTYRQERTLSWGYMTPPDEQASGHVTLTARPARRKP